MFVKCKIGGLVFETTIHYLLLNNPVLLKLGGAWGRASVRIQDLEDWVDSKIRDHGEYVFVLEDGIEMVVEGVRSSQI